MENDAAFSPGFPVLVAPGQPSPPNPEALAGNGGNMSTQVYATGAGGSNPAMVDHARHADEVPFTGILGLLPLGTATRYNAPQPGQNAGLAELVRGDDTRLGSGAAGQIGHDGADGRSAFEVAVDNGFTGTQAAWLASLQGAPGVAGVSNVPGPQGIQGIQGVQGEPGQQGIQGVPGAGGIGDMQAGAYAQGTGSANTTTVDHALYANLAGAVAYANVSGKPTLGTASPLDVAASGNASSSQVVKGNDSRLSDARTPSTHAASHAANGSDPLTLTKAQVSDFPSVVGDMLKSVYDANNDGTVGVADLANAVAYANVTGKPSTFSPSAHAASHASGGGDAVTLANTQVTGLGTSSVKDVAASGNASAAQVVLGNDGRLSDARTPSTHAVSHKAGGSDPVKLDELAAPTDVTTLNVTTSAHGLVPKGSGVSTNYLDGTGSWSTPSGSGGGGSGDMEASVYAAGNGSTNTHTVDHALYADAAPYSGVTGKPTLGTAAAKDIPASGDASSTQVVYGTDTRLTNSRTPAAHAASHASGGGDAVTLVKAQISDFPTLGTSAAKDIPVSGDASSTQVVYGTDSRLSDARTPAAHATSHKSGGTDAVKLDELAAPTDVTTLNVSSSAHGLAPKVPGNTTTFFRGDATYTILPANSTSALGTVAASPNNAYKMYRGDSTWAYQVGVTQTTSSFTIPAIGSTVAVAITAATFPLVGMMLYVSDGTNHGYFEVTVVTSTTAITVKNLGHSLNSAPSTTMASSAGVFLNSSGVATATGSGQVPTPPNDATKVLTGAMTYAAVAYANVTGTPTLGTSAAKDIPASGDATTGQVVYGTDTRLTDSRTPAAHAASHKSGGSDSVKLDEFAAPTDVTTLNATTSLHGLMPKGTASTTTFYRSDLTQAAVAYSGVTGTPTLGTAAAKDIPASGNAASTEVVYGTDTRLTDSRTPTTHAATHLTSGGDTIASATATAAGLVPTPPNSTNKWYLGNSTWAYQAQSTETNGTFTVPAAGSTVAITIVSAAWPVVGQTLLITDGTRIGFFEITVVTSATALTVSNRGYLGNSVSGTMATASTVRLMGPGIATATQPGFVPIPDNTVTHFLNGQMGYTAVPYSSLSGTPSTFAPSAHASSHQSGGADALALDTLSATTDVTTLNASTSAHGLLAKLSGTASQFLNGSGAFAAVAYAGVTGTPTLGTSAAKDIPASGNATSGQVVYGTDTRLTDTRTPAAHAATHLTSGGDTIASATASAAGLVPTPPNSVNKWYKGDSTWSFLAQATETNGTFTVPAAGSTVAVTIVSASWPVVGQTVFITDGTRVGFFEITVVTSATSITVANRGFLGNSTSGTMATASIVRLFGPGIATATQAGLVSTPPNNTTTFFRGDATFAAVPAATSTVSGLVPTPPNNTTTFLRGDATFAAVPAATSTVSGLVPTPPNTTTTYLRGDATFAAVPAATSTVSGLVPAPPNNVNKWYKGDSTWDFLAQSTETNGSFVVPAAGSTVAITIVSASWPVVGQTLFITDGTRVGFFEITVVTSATSITVANRGFLGNSVSGTMATASTVRLVGPGIATATQAGLVPTPDNTSTHFLNGQMGYTAPTYAGLGGSPPALDAVSAPTDITTLNATTSAHGLMPKGSASTTTFYRSDLTQAAVAYSALSGTPSTFAPSAHETSHITGGADLIPAPTTSATGLVPLLPSTNGSLQFLNGSAAFSFPSQTTATNGSFTVPAAGSTVAITIVSAAWPVVGQTVFITDGTRIGYFEITVVTSGTAITIANRGYLGNSVSGTMATGSIVSLQAPGIATATQPGFVPTPDNTSTHFLNGQMGYTAPTYAGLGGSPPALDAVSAPTDITTLNATTSAHGLMPKGTASTTTFYRSDATQATPPTVTRGAAGYAPASGGVSGTANYLREDLTWATPPGGSVALFTTNASFTCPAAAATVSVTFLSTTGMAAGEGLYIATAGLFNVSSVTNSTVAVMYNTGVTGNAVSGTIATAQPVYAAGVATVATSTLAGYLPAPPNNATTFLRGDATFATPPTVTTSAVGYAPAFPNNTTTFFRGDGTYAAVPAATATVAGLVPTPPNNTTTFLRGDATFAVPVGGAEFTTNASFTCPAAAATVSVTFISTTGMAAGMGLYITTAGLFNVSSVTNGTVAVMYNVGGTGNAVSGTIATSQPVYVSGVATVATSTLAGYVPVPPNNTTTYLRGDATFAAVPTATTSAAGLLPTLPATAANADKFLNGAGSWAYPMPLSSYPSTGNFTIPAVGSTVDVVVADVGNFTNEQLVLASGYGGAFALLDVLSTTPGTNTVTFINRGYGGSMAAGNVVNQYASLTVMGPGSVSATTAGFCPKLTNATTTFLRADGGWSTPPTVTRSAAGYAPASGGTSGTTNFLREDLSWGAPAGSTNAEYTTNASFTCPAAAATVSVTFVSTTGLAAGMGLYIATAGLFNVSSVTNGTVAVMYNTGGTGNAVSGTIATSQPCYFMGVATVATATLAGYVPVPPNNTTTYLRGDATFAAVPAATATVAGLVPTPPNNTTTFLRGDATFATPASSLPKPFQVWQGGLMGYGPSTLYATFGVRNFRPYVAFNDSATWTAYYMGFMPTGASLGSGLIIRLKWMGATATSGNVVWGVAIERMTTDQDADSFDSQTTATTATSGTSGIAVETAITATTIDSITAGDGFIIQVQRVGGNGSDTMTGDAQLQIVSVETVA